MTFSLQHKTPPSYIANYTAVSQKQLVVAQTVSRPAKYNFSSTVLGNAFFCGTLGNAFFAAHCHFIAVVDVQFFFIFPKQFHSEAP